MLPLSVLQTAKNQPMLVELKNGDTFNGHLVNCDNFMNINLRDVIKTSRDGDTFHSLKSCYIRGNQIKYLRIPEEVIDMVPDEPVYQPRGRGARGRGGRGRGGRGGRGRGGRGRGSGRNDGKNGGGGRGTGRYKNNNKGGRGGKFNNNNNSNNSNNSRNNIGNDTHNKNNNNSRSTPQQQPKPVAQKNVQNSTKGTANKAPSKALQMARARAEAKKRAAAAAASSE
jgi:U6 snRNA-associated Sm-like protein LSm4